MSTAAAERPARARLGTWPHDDDVVHLVLLDHQMVPRVDEIDGWVREAAARGGRTVRTGALFPASVPAFLEAGFHAVSTLTLLERRLERRSEHGTSVPDGVGRVSTRSPRRLRPSMLDEAAAIDRRCFPDPWSNDAATLADIMHATPQHRARSIRRGPRMTAFAISGRAGANGYIQRLAVDPTARRQGLATVLVQDALRWMRRRNVERVMVNTESDNLAALGLYRAAGFTPDPEPLLTLERDLSTT